MKFEGRNATVEFCGIKLHAGKPAAMARWDRPHTRRRAGSAQTELG